MASPEYLPVDESHLIHPVDFNGIHKYAAQEYPLLYTAMDRLDTAVLCHTNVYGPHVALSIPCQGFLANFLRRCPFHQPIRIFGDGTLVARSRLVGDVIEAFRARASWSSCRGAFGMSVILSRLLSPRSQ